MKFRNKKTGNILIPKSTRVIEQMKKDDKYEEVEETSSKVVETNTNESESTQTKKAAKSEKTSKAKKAAKSEETMANDGAEKGEI